VWKPLPKRCGALDVAARCVREGVQESLSYVRFPPEHWTRVRSNNMLERIMKEIRRRTRVVGVFPDGRSALTMVGVRLRHIAGTNWGTRRYLDMDRLRESELTNPGSQNGLTA
jgi:putative transposase